MGRLAHKKAHSPVAGIEFRSITIGLSQEGRAACDARACRTQKCKKIRQITGSCDMGSGLCRPLACRCFPGLLGRPVSGASVPRSDRSCAVQAIASFQVPSWISGLGGNM